MKRELISESLYHRLPEVLKDLTKGFENREKDIVLLSSIGVLSNCLPNIFGAYGASEVSPHLYILIIAPPASGKGTMNFSRILIEKIHEKMYSESRIEYTNCISDSDIQDKSTCPPIKVKVLPANISTAEVYSYLGSSDDGLVIIESEADTMGQMLKNDWSSYSDILRKAFHHETLSISRKTDKIFEEIKNPKLAMVISGTPDQLKPIIQSRENGLFSRFIIYNFDEVSDFKDVFATGNRNHKEIFKNIGDEVFELYHNLENLDSSIEFTFTEAQKKKFLKNFQPIHKDIIENHSEAFVSNVYRHGLICFRTAMILTILRNKNSLAEQETLVCSNVDFISALMLTKTLLEHSHFTFNTLENSGVISTQDESIIDGLNDIFKRKEAVEVGKEQGVPKRTIDDKLAQWQKKKIVKKVRKGVYKKL